MKKIYILLMLAVATLLFFPPPQDSLARITDAEKAEISAPIQLLPNSGFEARLTGWEKTGSSTLTLDSSTPLYGKLSALWDPSAASELMRSAAIELDDGMKGETCLIEMRYQWPSGVSGEIEMQALDQTNAVLASYPLDPATDPTTAQLNFDCPDPSTTQVKWALASTADAAQIEVDRLFIGSGKNTLSISQTVIAGKSYYPVTAGCSWVNPAGGGVSPFNTQANCPAPIILESAIGDWQTNDDDLPTQTINNLPAGKYKVEVVMATDGATGAFQTTSITDGTTTSPGCGATSDQGLSYCSHIFNYTSAGNRTFEIYAAANTGNTVILNDTDSRSLQWTITKYPSNPAEGINFETSGQSWSGYHDKSCSYTRTNAAFGEFTGDATCTLVTKKSGLAVTSVSDGTGVQPAIAFTPKVTQAYHVCAYVSITGSNNTVSNIKLTDGSYEIASYQTREQANTASVQNVMPLCGLYQASAGTPVELQVLSRSDSGSVDIVLGVTGSNEGSSIEWTVYPVDQNFPAPVFNEINEKPNAGALNVSDRKCTVTWSGGIPQSGNPLCDDWVTSYDDDGVGLVTLNFDSTTFPCTEIPVCVSSNAATASNNTVQCGNGTTTSVQCQVRSAPTSNASDVAFNLNCSCK